MKLNLEPDQQEAEGGSQVPAELLEVITQTQASLSHVPPQGCPGPKPTSSPRSF